jgi:hypothetical protein
MDGKGRRAHIMKELNSKNKELEFYSKNSERHFSYGVIHFKHYSDWKGGKSGSSRPVRKL